MSEQHDHKFLQLYTEELDYLRRMSGEFARQFPAVAGRLDLTQFDCQDPWVERLLEGVAYLTSRVRRELDGGLPKLAQSIVNIAEPRASSPLPSFALLALDPAPDLNGVFTIPKGTDFESQIPEETTTSCRWRSVRAVSLRPTSLAGAEIVNRGDPPAGISLGPDEKSWLELTLDFSGSRQELGRGGPFTVQLQGPPEFPGQILMCLRSSCTRIAICDDHEVHQWLTPSDLVDAIDLEVTRGGSEDLSAEMLLMQRYAALPQQFHGFAIRGIDPTMLPASRGRLKLVVVLDGVHSDIASRLEREMFVLHSVPVVNLIHRRADRIVLDSRSESHEIVVDRTRPMDYEIFDVDEVEGIDDSGKVAMRLRSVYDLRDQDTAETGFFNVERRQRPESEGSRRRGWRTPYRGTDSWMSISLAGRTDGPSISQLSLSVWCTNRDLPLLLKPGAACHPRDRIGAVKSGRLIVGPSSPRLPESDVTRQWSLLGHLGHGFMRMIDQPEDQRQGSSLQETLSNYINPEDEAARLQVAAIGRIFGNSVIRRRLVGRRAAEMRGFQCRIEIAESALRGGVDIYTLPLVLSRFLRHLIPVGGFLETSVVNQQGKVLYSWMPMDGLDSML